MWSALASIILGLCGWFLAKLLFEPLKEIIDLRREAQECLIVHGDLASDAPADERRLAADTFRRVGAGLVSRHFAAYPWVRWAYNSGLRWDIHSAGDILIGVGMSIQFKGFSRPNIGPEVGLIRNSLRLPLPKPSEIMRALTKNMSKPAPIEPGDLY
jgi:HAMP domain-containing protein